MTEEIEVKGKVVLVPEGKKAYLIEEKEGMFGSTKEVIPFEPDTAKQKKDIEQVV